MKKILLFMMINVLFGSYIFATSIDSRVNQSSDDAEQKASGYMYLDSSDLEFVEDDSKQTIGMRFKNLNIPKGANITNAYLQFEVDETSTQSTTLFIQAEASDNTQTFTTSNSNISNRPKTSNHISWSPVSWNNKNDAGLDQRTPNLKDIVQEIVDRDGWVSGNSMVFIIDGEGKRVAESYDGESSAAAHLHVEYESDTTDEIEVDLPTCYMMTDNKSAIYTVKPDSRNQSFLPSTTEIAISRSFKSEGNAYRAKDGFVYTFDSEDSTDKNVSIYSINPENGDLNLVKENLFYGTVEAAEFYIDASTGKEILYLLSHEWNTELFAFEPQNNWAISEGYPKYVTKDTKKLSSLAINPRTGDAYAAVDYQYDGKAPILYSINLLTGDTEKLTKLSQVLDAEGLAFGSDNNIYVEDERDGRKLYIVNPDTGEVTPAAILGGSGDFEAISCDGGKEYDFLSIADANSINEGDAGQKELKFVVSLNNIATEDVSFKYSIKDLNTNSDDYVPHTPNTLLTIVKGEQSTEITVFIKGDTLLESDEEFIVSLSDVTNAILVDANATGSILNDDILPTVSILDKECQERGDCFFTVKLNSAYVQDIYVDYTTEDASAKIDDNDYDYKSGSVKIDAGDTNTTIKIAITDDETPEYDELFNVILSNARVATGDYSESIYENGNDNTSKWSSYLGSNGNIANTDNTIKITNNNCTNACPNIGSSCTQGYILKDADGNDWANSSQFFASWDMRADSYAEIFFELQTRDNGIVYLTYTKELIIDKEDDGTAHNCSNDTLYTLKEDHGGTWWKQPDDTITDWGNYKYFSMGDVFEDDQWHHYKRDLKDDYKTLFPTDEILNVKKLYARVYNNGTLYIDNVKLSSHRELSITDKNAVGKIINDDFQEPFVCSDATLYLSNKYLLGSDNSSGSESNSMYLHWVDRTNSPFSYPAIGDKSELQYNALGYNVKDDFLYALYDENLLRIGKNGKIFDTGVVVGLPEGAQQYAGTFDADGNYYVSDWMNSSKIYKIDVNTLTVLETIEMSFSINSYDDMVFVGNKLYAASYPYSSNDRYTLWHIDLDAKEYKNIGLEQLAGDKIEILYSDNDTLYGVFRNGGLYEIDTVTAQRYYISDSPKLANLNDGANCQDNEIKFTDFGDAPSEYGEAGHLITNDLKLGTLVDHESGSQFSQDANGDGIDEDSIDTTKLPVLTDMSKTFTIENISIVNYTGSSAILSAWIDFDKDDKFDADEKIEKNIPNGTNITTLKWNNIQDGTKAGDTYLRIRLSPNFIGSKDLDADILDINHQNGEVEDYKIVIQESTTLNAWDVDAIENNRIIKTKKVNEDITLKIASLKKDGAIVESVLKDIKVYLMSENDNMQLTNAIDVNFSFGNPYEINFGKIDTSHKNTYVKFIYKDENNETMESTATDQFAIRPDRYTISTPNNLMAGKAFDITIQAVDVNGEVVSNYEEEKVVYDLTHAEVHSDADCSAKDLNVTKMSFSEGEAIINTTYDEVGKLKFDVKEFQEQGSEFASVDYTDSGDGRFISDGSTTSDEFAIGKIEFDSSFGNSFDYVLYANDLDDDSAKLFVGVTALNFKDEKVERFTNGCYAKDINVISNFNTTHTTDLTANVAYTNSVTANIELDIQGNSLNFVVSSELFTNGEGNQSVELNFERRPNIPLAPMKMIITDINASIAGSDEVLDDEEKEVMFIYAKAYAPDQSIVGKELNAKIGYAVYMPSNIDKADFGFGSLSESASYANWYMLPADLRFGFTDANLKYTSVASVQTFLVDRYTIPIISTSTPHKNRVFYEPRDYLLYDRFATGTTKHNFVVHLLSDKPIWSGKGKEGKKISTNASNRGLLKMDW